jgi:hypothetical protein
MCGLHTMFHSVCVSGLHTMFYSVYSLHTMFHSVCSLHTMFHSVWSLDTMFHSVCSLHTMFQCLQFTYHVSQSLCLQFTYMYHVSQCLCFWFTYHVSPCLCAVYIPCLTALVTAYFLMWCNIVAESHMTVISSQSVAPGKENKLEQFRAFFTILGIWPIHLELGNFTLFCKKLGFVSIIGE